MRDLTYPPIIVTAKLGFRRSACGSRCAGTEHVPRTGGALLALNHISYVDFVLGGLARSPRARLVRFMAKRELFDHRWTGPLMRSLHHISVDRADGLASFDEALRYLRGGRGGRHLPRGHDLARFEIKEFKTGATRIAAAAGVPLVPVVLWGTQRMMTKDHPQDFSRGKTIAIRSASRCTPTGADPVAETAELKAGWRRCSTTRSGPTPPTSSRPAPGGCPRRTAAAPRPHGGGGEPRRAEKRERARARAAKRPPAEVAASAVLAAVAEATAPGAGRGRAAAPGDRHPHRRDRRQRRGAAPPSSSARSPSTAPGPTSPSGVAVHVDGDHAVEDQEQLVAGLALPGQRRRPAWMRRTSGTLTAVHDVADICRSSSDSTATTSAGVSWSPHGVRSRTTR